MKNIKLITLLFIFGLTSCQPPQRTTLIPELSTEIKEAIAQKIEGLPDTENQKLYLENIYDQDQKVRFDQSDIEDKFGRESEEAQKGYINFRKTDTENLEKIEQYLTKYGHPTMKLHGEKAASAPWVVVHHAIGISARERNFKYLYQAFKNGDIDDGQLTFYLNRWYDRKFKHRIEWNRPYKIQEEIDTLIQSLEVKQIATEIDKEY